MSQTKGKYLKDENGEIFSPITHSSAVYNNVNNLDMEAITISFEGDTIIKLPQAWAISKIPFNIVINKINNNLTLSNNNIIIGSNIKYIEVSGNLNVWTSPSLQEANFSIELKRNNNRVALASADSSKPSDTPLLSLSISPIIWDVQNGDIIEFTYSSDGSGNHNIIGRRSNSYITVKKLY